MRLSLAGVPGVLAGQLRSWEPCAPAESGAVLDVAAEIPALPPVPAGNDGDRLRTALPFRLHDRSDSGGVVIDPDGLESAVRDLVARFGARLDVADLLERVEERAAVMEFDGGLGRGAAERRAENELLVWLNQLSNRPDSRPESVNLP